MKKHLFTLFALFLVVSTNAQEVLEEVTPTDEWPLLTKQILLVLFAVLCLFFAARTFRGKPDA
ncbi:MAG: membrane protein YdbS with pleckstrin-like domain [Flavobacteriales bacterium]|jgi:membrane protein YdbS with pleckstrin-like domain